MSGLVRYFVFFVIRLKTRSVEVAGIVSQPYGDWMLQVGRNLTDARDGFLRGVTHLLLDRDQLYTKEFRWLLEKSGVKSVRLPWKSPNLNSFAERWVLSAKSECLRLLIPLGEGHLRTAVAEYVAHYHGERNHQGLDNQLIVPNKKQSAEKRGR